MLDEARLAACDGARPAKPQDHEGAAHAVLRMLRVLRQPSKRQLMRQLLRLMQLAACDKQHLQPQM